jgi:hypothetical protein
LILRQARISFDAIKLVFNFFTRRLPRPAGEFGRIVRRERPRVARAGREAEMSCEVSSDCSPESLAECTAGDFYMRGMQCSIGGDVPADLVSAHMWFNLAAMQGHLDAVRLRREIATQMSTAEIGAAQRAARDFIKQHPTSFATPAQRLNAAA